MTDVSAGYSSNAIGHRLDDDSNYGSSALAERLEEDQCRFFYFISFKKVYSKINLFLFSK